MNLPHEFFILSFLISLIKSYVKNYRIVLTILLLITGIFFIYKALSFKEYLIKNTHPEYFEIQDLLQSKIVKKTIHTDNAKSLRRLVAITIKQMFLWTLRYHKENLEFTELVFAKLPTNSVRMTNFLIQISKYQNKVKNEAQEAWRTEKRDYAYEILNNPKHSIYTIYTSDHFIDNVEENEKQHQLFEENQKKYKNLKAIKYDALPVEPGCYFIFKVKEFGEDKYFLFYLKGKQDDEKGIEDEEVQIIFEEVINLKLIKNKDLRNAVNFWLKNK